MERLWIRNKFWSSALLLIFTVVSCIADKDPSVALRAPQGPSPVFSSSIDSIPVSSGSQQKNVFSNGPGIVHSSALASASGGGGSDQQRNNNHNTWNNYQGSGHSFDYAGGDSGGSGASVSFASSNNGGGPSGGYYEQPPPQQSTPSYGYTPAVTGGTSHGPAYTYYYQHYPNQGHQGSGWSSGGDGGDFLPGFSSFDGVGGVGGGIAGLKVAKVAAAIVKGLVIIKPILLILLLFFIAAPLVLFFLPFPIISITPPPPSSRSVRMGRSAQIASYLSQLSGKVLNSEECLERIICKMPQPPEKYQQKVRFVWDEYGRKMVTNARVTRGLNAYFEQGSPQKNKFRCNQRFKCSNKYL